MESNKILYKIGEDHTRLLGQTAQSVKLGSVEYTPNFGEFIIVDIKDTGLIRISRYEYRIVTGNYSNIVDIVAEIIDHTYGHIISNTVNIIPLAERLRKQSLREFIDKTMSEHNSNS